MFGIGFGNLFHGIAPHLKVSLPDPQPTARAIA
jgi:hypothetical protein